MVGLTRDKILIKLCFRELDVRQAYIFSKGVPNIIKICRLLIDDTEKYGGYASNHNALPP